MSSTGNVVVFFDLETTGLNHATKHKGVEIVSIGAISKRGRTFQQYVVPAQCPIHPRATAVHGMTSSCGSLYLHGKEVENALPPEEALERFIEFINSLRKSLDVPVVLVAHNNDFFDSWVLARCLSEYLPDYDMQNVFLKDSMNMARSMMDASPTARKGFSLNALMVKFLGRDQNAVHGALADAEDLRDLTLAMAEKDGKTLKKFLMRDQGISVDSRLKRVRGINGPYI